jgi:hypothetical protein
VFVCKHSYLGAKSDGSNLDLPGWSTFFSPLISS